MLANRLKKDNSIVISIEEHILEVHQVKHEKSEWR